MPEPMTTERLAAIRARAEAATEGPWEACEGGEPSIWSPSRIVIGNYTQRDEWESAAWEDGSPEDRAFIAAARTDVPDLLDHIETLTSEVERLRGALDAADRQIEARTGTTAGERLFRARAEEVEAERDDARAALDRVRAEHVATPWSDGSLVCSGCGRLWPCPTLRALDGDTP